MALSRKFMSMFMLVSAFIATAAQAARPIEVFWEDLEPPGFSALPPEPVSDHQNTMAQAQPNAPVVKKYDGKLVKVPGFVVPLEGTDDLTTEFLLVPFFGACVHVPPPASNQIIHVTFEEGVAVEFSSSPIWVTGVISTDGWQGDIASVGYNMKGAEIAPYSL